MKLKRAIDKGHKKVASFLFIFFKPCPFSPLFGSFHTKLYFPNTTLMDPDPDPLVRGMDPRIRIRIHTKMSWIRYTAPGRKEDVV
jgi:hypothetical protein